MGKKKKRWNERKKKGVEHGNEEEGKGVLSLSLSLSLSVSLSLSLSLSFFFSLCLSLSLSPLSTLVYLKSLNRVSDISVSTTKGWKKKKKK